MLLSYRREQAGRGNAALPDLRIITPGERLQAVLITLSTSEAGTSATRL